MFLTSFEQRLLQWLYTENKTGERTKPAFPPQWAKYCTLQKQSSKVVGVALERLSPLFASAWLHSFPLSYCPESEYLFNYQCIKFLLFICLTFNVDLGGHQVKSHSKIIKESTVCWAAINSFLQTVQSSFAFCQVLLHKKHFSENTGHFK